MLPNIFVSSHIKGSEQDRSCQITPIVIHPQCIIEYLIPHHVTNFNVKSIRIPTKGKIPRLKRNTTLFSLHYRDS